jgi:multiple antibiotic resistance protein
MNEIDTLIYAISLLFFIFDPFASLPIFISMTRNMDDAEKRKSANRAILVAALLFVIFTLLGTRILDLFGISLDAFRIAGGLVLILMAIEIIFGLSFTRSGQQDVAWVIIATPVLTGPGVITTAILLAGTVGVFPTIIAGSIALVVTWALLRNAIYIVRKVGNNIIEIFSKIIGLLLAAIAVEYILKGITDWLVQNHVISVALTILPHLFS